MRLACRDCHRRNSHSSTLLGFSLFHHQYDGKMITAFLGKVPRVYLSRLVYFLGVNSRRHNVAEINTCVCRVDFCRRSRTRKRWRRRRENHALVNLERKSERNSGMLFLSCRCLSINESIYLDVFPVMLFSLSPVASFYTQSLFSSRLKYGLIMDIFST